MSSLQQGGRGTQACINAHTHVQGIISDLDTTLMFVSSGALNAESDTETFADYRLEENFGILALWRCIDA